MRPMRCLRTPGLRLRYRSFEETTEIAQGNLVFWQQYPEGTELEKGTEVQYKVSRASSLPEAEAERTSLTMTRIRQTDDEA